MEFCIPFLFVGLDQSCPLFLNYFSNHAVNQKQTVIETLINRASTIISNSENQIEERKMIFATLLENDYPDWFIQRRKQMNEINQEQKDQRPNRVVILPFFLKCTNILSRILRKLNVKVYTKPYKALKDLMP